MVYVFIYVNGICVYICEWYIIYAFCMYICGLNRNMCMHVHAQMCAYVCVYMCYLCSRIGSFLLRM